VSVSIQQQEIRAIAREPCNAAGVLGLKFADIIHYGPKLTVVALSIKILRSQRSNKW